MKKYVLGLFLTIFAICFFASTSFADEVQRPAVYVYNEKLTSDIIVAYGGTTMAPFREIFEKYNMNVQWDSKTKSVTATSKDRLTTIKLAEDD
ncbi:stalk domain-containing protein [Paenibacillus cookii]|uniref:Copper amine oxidase-like N-terminal domain-containing protein n=1 Tax=Paenibacillus cookii TaxID=157839 RepID=A0ABQ4M454_9BACL|nr:stalk domain-containing protein [Paenibacillus cookii]GIO70271.1 hypothetical protein J21TS3_50920 [Paenibacillus cookii]